MGTPVTITVHNTEEVTDTVYELRETFQALGNPGQEHCFMHAHITGHNTQGYPNPELYAVPIIHSTIHSIIHINRNKHAIS